MASSTSTITANSTANILLGNPAKAIDSPGESESQARSVEMRRGTI
jgi:hypothetical protein